MLLILSLKKIFGLSKNKVSEYLRKDAVSLSLRRVSGVRLRQQVLNAQQNLLNRNSRSPVLLLVQNAQANRPRRVNIRVEQRRVKLAFRRRRRVVVFKSHLQAVVAASPRRVLAPGDQAVPGEEVHGAVGVLGGAGHEGEGVVFAPGLALFGEAVGRDSGHVWSANLVGCKKKWHTS